MFGTDGVRGIANAELTPEMALSLGRAGAFALTKENGKTKPRILLGTDTRLSKDMLSGALSAGLCSVGAKVYNAGVIPTPAIAYLVRKYGMDAGVMISASHNPMADNGIKFFNGDGYKLPDAMEDEIEFYFNNDHQTTLIPRPVGKEVGAVYPCPEALTDYVDFLRSTVDDVDFSNFVIGLDCSNGATSKAVTSLFQSLGATVSVIHCDPDGFNINENCGSTHIDSLQAHVKSQKLDIGFAFDGDGDRVLCVDENGDIMNGDVMLAVCGLDLHKRGLLSANALVSTVMSNMGLSILCRQHGITLYRTAVGDRYVLEKMLSTGCVLGGEQSGHIIFSNHNTTGDGMLTALQMLSVMKRSGQKPSEMQRILKTLPQVLVAVRVQNDRKALLCQNEPVKRMTADIEALMGGEGRILIRASGTEPVVRVLVESLHHDQANQWAQELAALIQKELGN